MANKFKIWISDNVNLSGFGKVTKALGDIKDKARSAFQSAPVMAFKNAIMGVGAALVTSVVEGSKFNVEMARVWTMAGGGISTFKKLREEARDLSSEFGIARSSMAQGMYNALSAGVDEAGMKSFMTVAAKVAVADGSDIAVAVDGITTVLNAFKIKSSETAAVADYMFKTVSLGKITFGELAANLATVAPVAAASNIPLKQILAHVDTLTAQGTPAAQAMTQIRASIMGLNKALGDGWSKNMSYQDALKKVWEKAKGSQTALLELVGSSEALQAVLGGVGANADLAAEKLKEMENSAGSLELAFWKVDQFRHWAPFFESARGALSKLGEEIDKRLHPFVLKITEKIQSWSKDKGLWENIGKFLDKAATKLDSVWTTVGDIVSQIKSVDDLGVVAGVIGDWIKEKLIEAGTVIAEFLIEKGPGIGFAIGKAALEALNPLSNKDSMNNDQTAAARDAATNGGENKVYSKEWREKYQKIREETEASNRQSRYAGESQKLIASNGDAPKAPQQPIADRILTALSTAHAAKAAVANTAPASIPLPAMAAHQTASGGNSPGSSAPGIGPNLSAAQNTSNEHLVALLSATREQNNILRNAVINIRNDNEALRRQLANNRG